MIKYKQARDLTIGNSLCRKILSFLVLFNIFIGISGSSSFGRATASQAVGGGFEPRLPL